MALNQREKALLTVPVLLGGVMSFYNWVHEPLSIRRSEATAQHEQVQAELKKDQARLAREGDVAARVSAVAAEEKLIDAWVPGKNAAALLVWYLSQAEQHSGVKIHGITVGEKKQVSNQPGQSAPANQPGAANPAPAQKPLQTPAPNQEQGRSAQAAAYSVTVVRLDLKVEGHFAEHLLFNQAVEQMPLFLNTDAIALERAEKMPLADVSKLLAEGKADAAGVMLSASPSVQGTYGLNLYFKTGKPGPQTTEMAFAEAAGRVDPFTMDGVDAFIQSVLDFYANPGAADLPARGGGRPGSDQGPNNSGQLG